MLLALALPLGVTAAWLLRGWSRFAALQAVVLAVGGLLGYAAYHPALPAEGDHTVSGVIAEEIRLREDGQVRTVLQGVVLDGKPQLSGAYWTFYLREGESLPTDIAPGRRVTLTAKVYHPQNEENPGGYNFREYLLQRGVTIGVYGCNEYSTAVSWHPLGLAAALRSMIAQRLVSLMGEEAGGYAATMLLGSRNLIPEEDRQAFSRLGIAHILSVSGFHVGVLAGLVTWLLKRWHLSRRLRFACTSIVLGCYILLTGMNAPVIRAVCLYLLYEFGALKHRQRSSLHLLSASWVLQLVLSPAQLTGMSFQLSYGAMLGLVLVSPWMESLWQPARGQRIWRSVCAAIGAQMGILLPQLYWFQELPLLGTALNLVVISASAVVIRLCWVLVALLPIQALAEPLAQLTAGLLNGMLIGVRWLGDVQGMMLWTARAGWITAAAWSLMLLGMSWWWPGRRRFAALALLTAVLAASVVPWPHTGTEYIQLSVGAEDAALLYDEQTAVAIDAGEDGAALAAYLHQRRISLDALIITHLHRDHAGGIRALLDDRIPVDVCYLPWGAEQALVDEDMLLLLEELAATGTDMVHLGRGDQISLPSGHMTVLWPERGKVRPGQEANESSMALLAQVYGSSMLLTGDLDGIYEMYAAVPADILKVAHHGSEKSTSAAFLERVGPSVLVLSCGNEERAYAVQSRCGGIALVDTCTKGAVMIDFDEAGFTVKTLR